MIQLTMYIEQLIIVVESSSVFFES